jgi:hypothetical protein
MRRPAKFALIASAIAAGAFGLWVYWNNWGYFQYAAARAGVAHSSMARSLRCRGVARPLLTNRTDWALAYSWTGGLGVGDVWLSLNPDGTATLRAKKNGAEDTSTSYRLAPEQVKRIAGAVDESGLLCLDPLPRKGYVVEDLGRFSVQVSAPQYSKLVYIDRCTTVNDARAMAQVISEIAGLKSVIGDAIAWGPMGTYTGPGSCDATSNNRWRGP